MLRVNEYNVEKNVRGLIISLAASIAVFVALNFFLPASSGLRSGSVYVFFMALIYFTIRHLTLRKISRAEELRQLRLDMKKTDKRTYQRHMVDRQERMRVTFSATKYLWLFELHKKRIAKPIDISEGGLQVETDTTDILEGTKATCINIRLADVCTITADGLIVRVTPERCSIKFINLDKNHQQAITKYILDRKMEEQWQKTVSQ